MSAPIPLMTRRLAQSLIRAGWATRDPRVDGPSTQAVLEWTDAGTVTARVSILHAGDVVVHEFGPDSRSLVHFDTVDADNVDRVLRFIRGAEA